MLIIAQPKTASTSLASTIGKVMKRSWHQLEFAKNNVGRPASLGPSHIKRKRTFISLPHSDIIDYSKKEVLGMAGHKDIFKQHIPPTKNNLEIITKEKVKCLILLRDPESSVKAYKHASNRRAKLIKDKNDFQSKLKEMKKFNEGWEQLKDWPSVKVVYFEDLILNQKKVLNEVLDFFGMPKDNRKNVVLDKKRYTGIGLRNLLTEKEKEKKRQAILEEKRKESERQQKLKLQKEEEEKQERLEHALAQSEEQKPKGFWRTIFSWFGFGK